MLFDYRWLSNQYNFLHSYSCLFFLCARLLFYSSPKELVLSRCTYQQLLEMSTWTKQVNHVVSTSISLQSLIKYLLTDWISIKIDSVRSPAICNPLLYPAPTCNENPKFEMISAWQALEALYKTPLCACCAGARFQRGSYFASPRIRRSSETSETPRSGSCLAHCSHGLSMFIIYFLSHLVVSCSLMLSYAPASVFCCLHMSDLPGCATGTSFLLRCRQVPGQH